MLKNKATSLTVGAMALAGLVAGFATMAGAQSTATTAPATSTATVTTQSIDTPEKGDTPDATGTESHKHAPLGGDGVVSSVSGTTIIVGEESDEGGATYTVDASKATFTNNGATASISDIKAGQKIFVQGTTSGTNVSATSISIGHKGNHVENANETDGNGKNEANDPADTGDTSGN
jgi:hypothetical protein